jgi:hypothetical protein
MDKLLMIIFSFLRKRFYLEPNVNVEVAAKLREIESTQQQILQLIQEARRDDVPRNANRIYKIGSSRTVLFLNELLPQVYLTLVSVLQGVALAVLVDQFNFDFAGSNITTYGYIFSSFLIIVAFWHSYLNAIFDGRWPFRFIDTLLFFMAAATEAIAIRNVTSPSQWCLAIALMCVFVAVIYFRQVSLLAELVASGIFEDPNEGPLRIRSVRVYVLFFSIAAVMAFVFVPITATNPQNAIAPVLAIAIPVVYIVHAIRGAARFGVDAIG